MNLPIAPSISRRPAKNYWQIDSPQPFKDHANRFMKQKIVFLLVLSVLLAACSTGHIQAPENPVEVNIAAQAQPTTTPAAQAVTLPAKSTATSAPAPIGTPERKALLQEDAWKDMP